MSENNPNIIPPQLPAFIKSAIDEQIQKITEEELLKASEKIKAKSAQVIAGVILHIEKQMSFATSQNEIIITLKIKE